MSIGPLIVDGDAASWRSYYVENAATIYEKAVWVRIHRPEREESLEELVVRMLMGTHKHNHHSKMLRVQLTSEEDPFFLHTLEVTEEDFQNLKVEQSILVDFSTFPQEFITLLDACIESRSEENPRFRSVLKLEPGFSTFSIFEVNQFRHLSHLNLHFRPGNDSAIKQYLAARLFEVKGERQNLRDELVETKASLQISAKGEEKLSEELADQREANARVVGDMRNAQAALLNDAKRKALLELEETTQKYEADILAASERHREQMRNIELRNDELDLQVRTLMDQKYALDTKVSELSAKLGTAEGELSVAREDLIRLRQANKELDHTVHENQKQINQQLIRITGLEQQVKDKDELNSNLRSQLSDAEASKKNLETSWQEARTQAQRAEERVQAVSDEIKRGNQIIERLQAELRSSKAKAKLKAAVIAQQENLLQERQTAIDKTTRALGESNAKAEALEEEKTVLNSRVEDQKSKLEESQTLLQSNQQMIQWLNQQVNEAQVGAIGSGSRYHFRPSISTVSARPGVTSSSYTIPSTSGTVPPSTSATAPGGPVHYRPQGSDSAAARSVRETVQTNTRTAAASSSTYTMGQPGAGAAGSSGAASIPVPAFKPSSIPVSVGGQQS